MPSIINTTNIKHPDTFSIENGQTLLVKNIEAINQSIRLILTTSTGELFGDPEFGCRLQELLFDLSDSVLVDALKEEIVRALKKYEPRIFITENDIEVTQLGRTVEINLSYNLRYTELRSSYRYITEIKEETNGYQ